MESSKLKSVLETLLFVATRPLTPAELAEVVGETPSAVSAVIAEMKEDFKNRGSSLQVADVAEGHQLATQSGYTYWVKKLFRDQTSFHLSQSAMETLSIVAYKQPITRAEIEEIRGVEVSGVLETLLERKLITIAGRKETVGRPLLYATTPEFLRHFYLWKISDLPSLEDLAKESEAGLEEKNPENIAENNLAKGSVQDA